MLTSLAMCRFDIGFQVPAFRGAKRVATVDGRSEQGPSARSAERRPHFPSRFVLLPSQACQTNAASRRIPSAPSARTARRSLLSARAGGRSETVHPVRLQSSAALPAASTDGIPAASADGVPDGSTDGVPAATTAAAGVRRAGVRRAGRILRWRRRRWILGSTAVLRMAQSFSEAENGKSR